jgi:hypothetical protein
MFFQQYLKKLNKIPRTRKNLTILFVILLSLIILPYAFYSIFLQYPLIKNRTYFHCTQTPNEWPSYRLENFEMYDVRIKDNVNVYVTVVKFYDDREFITQKIWYGAPTLNLFQPGSTASFAFDTEKYLVFRIPINGEDKPQDYFVLNRFDLTVQIITQNFLSIQNKKLSLGNSNLLNSEVDELFKKKTELDKVINKAQRRCNKVPKPTRKI